MATFKKTNYYETKINPIIRYQYRVTRCNKKHSNDKSHESYLTSFKDSALTYINKKLTPAELQPLDLINLQELKKGNQNAKVNNKGAKVGSGLGLCDKN